MESLKQQNKIVPQHLVWALLKHLFSKKLVILGVAAFLGVVGILVEWMKKPMYTAEVTFTSENDKGGALGAYSSLASQFGIDLGGMSNSIFQGDNLMEFFRTRKIVEKALLTPYKGKLMIDAYIANNKINKNWDKKPGFNQLRFEQEPSAPNRLRDSMQTVIYESIVKKSLSVDRPNKKLSFIVLKMTDRNEEFAKDFSLTVTETAIKYYTEYRSKKARENYEVIQKQTDSVKALLFGNIENYAETNDLNVNPLKQRAKVGTQKIQVNTTVNSALYTELLKQSGLAKLALEKETPLIQIMDTPVLPLKTNKKSRLMSGILFASLGGLLFVLIISAKFYLKNSGIGHSDKTVNA